MVLINILGFIIKKFSFKKFTYITSLNNSLQLFYLSKALRPFKIIPKDMKFRATNRVHNTIKLLSTLNKRDQAPITRPQHPTNFINNHFYSSKHHLSSSQLVMVGGFFNDNSAELLPLKDWRFTALLNSHDDHPSKLTIKKRYRSWSFNKATFSLDRRRKLSFKKITRTSHIWNNRALSHSINFRRLLTNRYFKLCSKHKAFTRWITTRLHQCGEKSYSWGSDNRSISRKMRRALVQAPLRNKSRLSHLRRLKKIGYRSNRLRARFLHNHQRAHRLKIKSRLRTHVRRSRTTHDSPARVQAKSLTQATGSYSSLLKARSIRRRLKNQLNKPAGWPYVRFQLTPRRKSRRLRRRGRRYRSFFQKNYSVRTRSSIKAGAVIRMLRSIGRLQYKNRHLRLPPTDFTRHKLKKTGRWKHSYPYMFTNNILSNKKLGRSTVQNLLSHTLSPIRLKRRKRVKFNAYKRFARLKNPRWVVSSSSNLQRLKNVPTKVKVVGTVAKVRRYAFRALSRWLGSSSKNTNTLYVNTQLSRYSTTRRIYKPIRSQMSAVRFCKQKFGVGNLKKQTVFNRNITTKNIINYKLRLNWLYKPRKSFYKRLKNFRQVQGSKVRCNPRTTTYPRPSIKTLVKVSLGKGTSLKVLQAVASTSYLNSIVQLPAQHKLRVAPRPVVTSPLLRTRTNINFILKPYLQFFNRLVLRNSTKPYTYKFMFKKKLYSFLYPNQVRNALLSRKKKITFYKLVYKTKLIARSRPFYWPRNLKKHFNLNSHTQTLNKVDSIFGPTSSPRKLLGNFKNQLHDITNENHFSLRGGDNSFKTSEVRIPRIRFKPGYQRLWRQARTALQESLRLRFIYQKKLSRYIVRFFKQTNSYTFSRSEMSLEKTLMYSRLLPDIPTVNVFLQQNLVYLNGLPATNNKASVFQNDLLQLIVSKWYYLAYRWIANWTLKRHKKFKRLVYRKGLAGKHKVMKLRKQKSYYTPHWIYLARYDISDIKPYLEVDYMTLSVCVIYNPYLLYYYSPDDTPDLRSTIYRLYNWKYIT